MKSKVDQINDAFVEILAKENSAQYKKYIKSINDELIDNIDSLTPSKIKSIVKNAKINIDDLALLFTIQNAVLLITSRKPIPKKDKISLAPIIALVGLYSLKRPKRFVKKLVKINKGVGLNESEKKANALLREYKRTNIEVLDNARKVARKQLDISQIKRKTTKHMIKDLNVGLKEKKSLKKIKVELNKKYNKPTDVERVLRTELHSQSELVRREHSKSLGYTHKKWNTQSDTRVRHTKFHDGVANKSVPIDSDFRASGFKAEYPGDTSLPPSERINCRCYLTYE